MAKQDASALDKLYNNRLLVPDCMDMLQRWTQDSVAVRQLADCKLDVTYGQDDKEKLDIFPSTLNASSKAAPVLIFIHGGYWRSLDKADQSFLAPAFTKAGSCVVIPNYSLCPAVTVSDIVLQLVKAVAWVYKNIDRYGGDPKRITVAGHSAGGHLVAILISCLWGKFDKTLPSDVVKNALSISGLFEMETPMHSPYLQDSLHLTVAEVKRISPAWMPAPKQGLLYSVVGGDESPEFLRHNQLIQDAWGKSAVPVSEQLPSLNHFTVLESLCQSESRLHQLAQALLQK
ncbi:MAG: alpha/beta hydrolase [Burkholderiaceae bacterium]